MHSKWSPVTIASFYNEPIVTLEEDKLIKFNMDIKEKIIKSCP